MLRHSKHVGRPLRSYFDGAQYDTFLVEKTYEVLKLRKSV